MKTPARLAILFVAFAITVTLQTLSIAGTPSGKEPIAPGPVAEAATIPPPMFGDLPYIEQDNFTSILPHIEQDFKSIKDGTSNIKNVLPIVTQYGALKIAENESPLPLDRVFVTYNYYSEVLDSDFHRETLGFEKTFLGGEASIGLRVPVFEFRGDTEIDDLNLISKFVLYRKNSSVISGGLAVSIPVRGYEPILEDDTKHIPLLQPYVGYIWQKRNFFIHGFSSIAVPTDDILPTVLFNDVGVGYRIETDGACLTAIIPTFEVHVNTPLNHRGNGDAERRRDAVDLTAGAHFELWKDVIFGLAVGTTVTNPRLFNVEGIASLNWKF